MEIIRVQDSTSGKVFEKSQIRIDETNEERRVCLVDGANDTNERVLRKTSNVSVTYTCATCQRENTAKFCSFWKKWHKGRTCCSTCVGLAPEQNPMDKIRESYKDFNDNQKTDEVFKKAYWRKYLNVYEFERIRGKMVSFQHDKFDLAGSDVDDFVYVPTLSVASQFRFVPTIYDTRRDALEKPLFIRWKCDDCSQVFETRELCTMKNKLNVLCGACNFSNNVVKTMTLKNCIGEAVTYTTKFDHKFLKWCLKNNVRVLNGDKTGSYKVYSSNDCDSAKVKECVLKNKPSWTHKTGKGPLDVFPDTYVAFCKSLACLKS